MEITKFINSKSVAKYLKYINYAFSPQEAAFIIAHSRKNFKSKRDAWEALIDKTPDCGVICRSDYPQYPSLHAFLIDYMALTEKAGKKADAEKLRDEEYFLFTAFDFMWFATPAPFVKGDIVYNVTDKSRQPFVINDLSYWEEGATEKRKNRDWSDMSAHEYILRDGNYDYDFTANYLDFEYCTDDMLKGENRALLALSGYMKGNVDLEHFLNAYLLICDEERIHSAISSLCVGNDALKLAGLDK